MEKQVTLKEINSVSVSIESNDADTLDDVLDKAVEAVQNGMGFTGDTEYELENVDGIPVENESENQFIVETPMGYLMVEKKGDKEKYPGVYIRFSKDGTEFDVDNIISCVEYDSAKDCIQTCAYTKNQDWPDNICVFDTEPKEDKE